MAQNFDKAIDTLEKLVVTCRNGQEGYRQAAEHAKAPELKEFFNHMSLERAQSAGELEQEVQKLGVHDPNRKGSTAGALHRAWFELKEKLGGGDESILNSVESGEDTAKKDFEDALKEKEIPSDIREVIAAIASKVEMAHNKARDLRDRFKNAA